MEIEEEKDEEIDEDLEDALEELEEETDEPVAPKTPEVFDVQLSPDNGGSVVPPPPKPQVFKLNLYFEGELLPPSTSLFQSIQRISRKQEMTSSDGAQPIPVHTLWDKTHSITYSVAESKEETSGSGMTSLDGTNSYVPPLDSPYLNFINSKTVDNLDTAESTKHILTLLRILNELNHSWSSHVPVFDRKVAHKSIISPTEFINSKLTAKVMRQLQDPLTLCSGALPEWCKQLVYNYSFLFPFESRRLYFFCTSFGIARALHALQQHLMGTSAPTTSRNSEFRVGRIQRQKVRIARTRLLDSMLKVMELYGKSKGVLEVEYFGEVGTGLGPTLEFYTLASRDLQRKDLNLWRDEKPLKEPLHPKDGKTEETTPSIEHESTEHKYVFNAGGLFPTLIKPGDDSELTKKILGIFRSMGTFVAKAMLDSRLLDMHYSRAFLKWMLNRALTFDDLKDFDPDFGNSMEKIAQICRQAHVIELDGSLSQDEKNKRIEGLKLGECPISDLNLDFTMPGRPQWELKANGRDTDVTINNLEEYLNLIVQQYLLKGVSAQLDAFKIGFNLVFPIENLGLFNSEELELILCGAEQSSWDMQTLLENTRCDHGYTHDSLTVKFLLEIMTEMSPKEQRQFLLFVTGSPNLPPGGFKSLDPKLTIVRKESDGKDPDSYLPSVNCCFYYLKLPEYTSKKVLKEKLMFSIENGQGSFSFN